MSRLPDKYRVPIVLCELEGKTHREAAHQLGCPVGTVSGRLSRAKAILARRLSQPGRALSVDLLAALLTHGATTVGMPTKLIESTAHASTLFATSRALSSGLASARVTTLTTEVLKMMLLKKLIITAAVLLLGVAFVAGGTSLAYFAPAAEREPQTVTSDVPANPQQTDVLETPKPEKEPESVTRAVPASPQQAKVVTPTPSSPFAAKRKSALPGNVQAAFGGGPDQPRYMRHDNLFFVVSPSGDKFSIYDALTKKSSVLRLPASKESPLKVIPIIGASGLGGMAGSNPEFLSLHIEGPKITRIHVFSFEDWKWYGQELKQPAFGNTGPTMGRSVAAFAEGRRIHAFSAKAKRWSILDLPEGIKASPAVYQDSVVVEYDGQVYEFGGDNVEWKHTDLRAVVDAALESAKEEAK